MKKLISVLLSVVMLVVLSSCNNNGIQETETTNNSQLQTDEHSSLIYYESTSDFYSEFSTENETNIIITEKTTSTVVTTVETDPSEWSAEETVEFYRASARKSQKVKSVQKMTLKDLTVNDGDGTLGKLVEVITPFFVSALEKNSTEFEGITGGFENLTVSDTASVKAYKEDKYTVIEMTMKEQTDGVHADNKSGTVGHAISVVGDISVVE